MCKIAANYRGDHVPEGNPPQNTCDALIATYSVDSGFPGGGAGPFNGIDFSQPYDCSASSDAIKSSVNLLGSTLAGCCGANGGAPESACFVAPSGICLTDADWTGESFLVLKGSSVCRILSTLTCSLRISFSLFYRGIYLPLKRNINIKTLLPFNWAYISLIGLGIDIVKAPGYIAGGFISPLINLINIIKNKKY